MGEAADTLLFRPARSARLAELRQLLVAGGDERTRLNPDSGRNRYGCSPLPDPELVALGSCTASTISTAGHAAAAELHQRIWLALQEEEPTQVHARESFRIRQKLLELCGLDDVAGLEVVLAASGTDAHRQAARRLRHALGMPLHILTLNAEETGSEIPAALAEAASEIDYVPLRHPDGAPRTPEEIDADFSRLASQAITREQTVLLVLTDVSKTGLLAPSPALATELRLNYPHHCEVLVDASQFRISSDTLRGYLEQDFMVVLTGSKFIGGPSFSGALLLPACVSQWLGYSESAAEVGVTPVNFGLLLRWQAALEELEAFRSLPVAQIRQFLRAFSDRVRQRLETDPQFAYLPVNGLQRGNSDCWNELQTIFSFVPLHPDGRPLDRAATARLHQRLQLVDAELPATLGGLRFQLGQPVNCGVRQGVPVSALRLCSSARMVVEAHQHGLDASIGQALSALDKLSAILKLDMRPI